MSEITVPTKNEKLIAWVEEIAALTKPDVGPLVRRLGGGVRPRSASSSSTPGRSSKLSRRQAPELLPRAGRTRPTSRASRTAPSSAPSARRTPARRTTGATPAEMREHARRPVRRRDAAAARCTSCRSRMGPLGSRQVATSASQLTDSPYVAVSHADHDPHGPGRARRARRATASSSRACTRSACRSSDGAEDVPWPCNDDEVHRPLPRDARDLVLRLGLRRQRAARQEVLRAAHRLGDGARRGLDGRAHAHPQAHLAGGQGQVHHRRLPVARAARRTSRC